MSNGGSWSLGVKSNVFEDTRDDGRLSEGDERNELHLAATPAALQRVHFKYEAEQLGPSPSTISDRRGLDVVRLLAFVALTPLSS
jgi:hypothetical protein